MDSSIEYLGIDEELAWEDWGRLELKRCSCQNSESESLRHLPDSKNASGGYARQESKRHWTSFERMRTWSLSMNLPSQRHFIGLGRVGKVSGLVMCMER